MFKHGIYSTFFPLQNTVCFIILTYLVPVLFTFYIQGVLKLKNNSDAKRSIATDVSTARIAFKISSTTYKSTERNVPEDFILPFIRISSFSRKNHVILLL
jgi:hypothetical protein